MSLSEQLGLAETEKVWLEKEAPVAEPALEHLGDLLDEVAALTTRYIAFTNDHHRVTVTLWAAHTHLADRLRTTPYLHITSPEKESGKSQLLDVLELVVHNPWLVLMPSPAVLYRKIDKAQEKGGLTLLLDEVDPVFKRGSDEGAEALRGVLNAGYQKGRTVPRCVGPSLVLTDFQVYGPKALAGIGDLPDTVAGRSIRIGMKRRKPSETVEAFFPDEIMDETEALRTRLAASVARVDLSGLREVRRELLQQGLGDRAVDIWSSLVVIADAAGGPWPEWARDAAAALSAKSVAESDGLGVRLLEDCRLVLAGWEDEHIWSDDLRSKLLEVEDGPWSDYKGGSISQRTIAYLLRGYDIRSGPRRIGETVRKGYRIGDFQDAFARYLPPSEGALAPYPALSSGTSGTSLELVEKNDDSQALHLPFVTDRKTPKNPIGSSTVSDVPDRNAHNGDRGSETSKTDPDPTIPGAYQGDHCRCGATVWRYTRTGYPYCRECGPE